MADDGKLTRAYEKAGAADALRSSPDAPDASSETIPVAPTRDASPLTTWQRVQGMCGLPDPAVVVGQLSPELIAAASQRHVRKGNAREVASQIRAVRARILAMNDGDPPRVIMVTSSTVAEGKTTLALNLAAALSEIDSSDRVLALDGDMPAPALHQAAGLKAEALLEGAGDPNESERMGAKAGLCTILDDGLDLDGSVYETAIDGLDLIPGRPVQSEDGYERKLNEHCEALLQKLREQYSFVIVDTPPVHAASQAHTFAKHCDGVIVVSRLERTSREVVRRTIDELQKAGATIIGCVLNQQLYHVPSFLYKFFGIRPEHYYGYGYGYYYGYGYGYRKHRNPRTRKDKAGKR